MLKTLFKSLLSARRDATARDLPPPADAGSPRNDNVERARARVASEPGSGEAWLALAKALQGAGEPREAIAACHEALARGGASAAHLRLGALHAELSEHRLAVEHLEKAIALSPEDADALCMLGTVMGDLGRYDEAATWYGRALALRPDMPEAHFNLGLARFEREDFAGAVRCFARCAALNRGEPWGEDPEAGLERDPEPGFEPKEMAVNEIKLRHDCEQLAYLLELGRLPPGFHAVLRDYRSLLEEVRSRADAGSVVPFDARRHPLVARTYKRPFHIAQVPLPPGPVVNPKLDFRAIEDRYLQSKPSVVAVDELLAPAALAALRRFCMESTIWNDIKPGYLGAYFYDGFCNEQLLRLAWELRRGLERVMGRFPFCMMWGYKCDSALPGLGVHADAAAVNVNFWITDDGANLDPSRGGLLVYPQDAPRDWGFSKFNMDSNIVQRYLESAGAEPLRVPYRANRAVIFDSDLFHASDRPRFRDDYSSRRINITLLYGTRSQ